MNGLHGVAAAQGPVVVTALAQAAMVALRTGADHLVLVGLLLMAVLPIGQMALLQVEALLVSHLVLRLGLRLATLVHLEAVVALHAMIFLQAKAPLHIAEGNPLASSLSENGCLMRLMSVTGSPLPASGGVDAMTMVTTGCSK